MSAAWHVIGPLVDLPEGEPIGHRADRADGTRAEVVLVRRGDAVHAFHDRCPHRAAPLSELGFVDAEAGTLVCGWHYWAFALDSGDHTAVPGVRLCQYPVRVDADGLVSVDLSVRPAP